MKLSNTLLNKLKLAIKIRTVVSLKIWSNALDDSNDENSFPHKLLLTNIQVWRLQKIFVNNSSANKKLSKPQWHKIRESGIFR